MAIPDYQSIMLPLLRYAGDGNVHYIRDATTAMADHFELTEEERQKLIPSGRQTVISSRVSWSRTYLKKAGLLKTPKRGYFQITESGRAFLDSGRDVLTVEQLYEYEGFGDFKDGGNKITVTPISVKEIQTPEEMLDQAIEEIREELAEELLARIKSCSPPFFEHLVVDLLVAMGYGGSRREAGEVLGRSGDGGIDGIIKEDKLGLDTIYLQAKRWESSVGRPEIQRFVGALQGVRARKGVFITTSHFTAEAKEYASSIDTRVVLIDGQQLASLMIDHNLGVGTVRTYTVQRIDSDYFMEE